MSSHMVVVIPRDFSLAGHRLSKTYTATWLADTNDALNRGRHVDVRIEDPGQFIIFIGIHSNGNLLAARIHAICAQVDRLPSHFDAKRINKMVNSFISQGAKLIPTAPGEPPASTDRFLRAAGDIMISRKPQPLVVVCEKGIVKTIKGRPALCNLLWLPAMGADIVAVFDEQCNFVESIRVSIGKSARA